MHVPPRLVYVLRGVRRIRGERAARPRLPITPDILRALCHHWSASGITYDVVMLWAACCLSFFGFLRAGEFTVDLIKSFDPSCHLTPVDVSVDSREAPQIVRVVIKQSKTDPFRRGAMISREKSGNELCPVSAVLAYLARRGSSQGPLFIFSDGSPLSRQRLVSYLRESLSFLDFNCELYSGHSFRIGAATTAAATGLEDSVIRSLGRWRSDAYQRYIRRDARELAQFSRTLATANSTAMRW